MRTTTIVLCAAFGSSFGMGCSAGTEGALISDEATLASDDVDAEEVAEIMAALSSDTNCGSANADSTYTSVISPDFTSPSTYSAGRNGCGSAYFVRVNDYRTGNTTKYNTFSFGGAVPNTETACRDIRLMVYAFERKSDGTVQFVASKSKYGVWTNIYPGIGNCTVPRVNINGGCSSHDMTLTTGRNYQFAVSARTNNAGTPVMQPISMGTNNLVRCGS